MPLYEYKCDQCETKSEFNMKISDPHPESCPSCGGGPLRKVISPSAFLLKGSGWYKDGYAGQSNKPANAKEPAATGSDAAASGGEGKSAPATDGAAAVSKSVDSPSKAPAEKKSAKTS